MTTIITIQTRTQGAVPCRAIVRGVLAIHRTYRPGPDTAPWTLTHVPSGRVVAFATDWRRARRLLRTMSPLPWPERPTRSQLATRSQLKRYFGKQYMLLRTAIAQARKSQP